MKYLILASILILGACAKSPVSQPATAASANWAKTFARFQSSSTNCKPQTAMQSQTLVTQGNFYGYADGKSYLDLDASTGIYRRIWMGTLSSDGTTQGFSRMEGCFFSRYDSTYGMQLLLATDVAKWASSEDFWADEIFSVTNSGSNVQMQRFDSSSDWDYTFCPTIQTPDSYCTNLRNGNIVYEPVLNAGQESELLNEALLIRTKFSYAASSSSDFNSMWSNLPSSTPEHMQGEFQYSLVVNVDTPAYTWQAWKAYVQGKSNIMPDTTSSNTAPICYQGSQNVTLSNGSTGKVYGEICYTNGAYTFTQN